MGNYKVTKIEFFILSLIYYGSTILNIYQSIKWILSDELAYGIIFWVSFSLEKLILTGLIICLPRSDPLEWQPFIIDFFQLGPVCVLMNKPDFSKTDILSYLLGMRILPHLLIQTIFYFGIGILNNSNTEDSEIILAYSNYLVHICMAAYFSLRIMKERASIFDGITPIAGFIVWGSVLYLSNALDFNLGYLHFIFVVLEAILIYLVIKRKDFLEFGLKIHLCSLFYAFHFSEYKKLISFKQHLYISGYFQNLINFLIFISLASSQLDDDSTNNTFEKILLINTIIGIIFGLAYLIRNLKNVLKAIFCFKAFIFINDKVIKQAISYLKQSHKYIHSYEFYFINPNNHQIQYNLIPLNSSCNNQKCELHYKLLKRINELYKNPKNSLKIKYLYTFTCPDHSEKMMLKICDIDSRIFGFLNAFNMKKKQIKDIIHKRIDQGFGNNLTTILIVKIIQNPNYQQQHMTYLSVFLSLVAFTKLIEPKMIFSASQILYDLYGLD